MTLNHNLTGLQQNAQLTLF